PAARRHLPRRAGPAGAGSRWRDHRGRVHHRPDRVVADDRRVVHAHRAGAAGRGGTSGPHGGHPAVASVHARLTEGWAVMSRYRINYTIQRAPGEDEEDYEDVGFGSSGDWAD